MNAYITGQVVRVSVAFTVNSVATDPTTVTVKTKDQDGNQTTSTAVTKDSTGNYHYDITTTTDGVMSYRFEGAGACVAASEGQFLCSSNFV